jgi:hypothetical protein
VRGVGHGASLVEARRRHKQKRRPHERRFQF